MSESSRQDVTELLLAWSGGDASALEQLMPVVYHELHRLASRYVRQERPEHTLQATALVNEAYLRLIQVKRMRWQNRAHFFALSAQIMRRILVEFSRRRNRHKRGGPGPRLPLSDALETSSKQGTDLLGLDEALSALAGLDPRLSQVVELRFFGGLSVEETAEVLKVSEDTVTRDWKTAQAWLLKELSGREKNGT